MKILIAYYTKTGNTELVAKSMAEGLVGNNVTLLQVKDVDPSSLYSYEVVFLGSGVYAGSVNKAVKQLIKKTPKFPSKFVLFYTHASEDNHKTAFKVIKKIIGEKNCQILAEFDCLGESKGISEEQKLARLQTLSHDEKRKSEEWMKKLEGRPNKEDLENAKLFSRSIIEKI